MKIAIVNNEFGMGGLQRVASVIGRELSKKNEVFFYALNNTDNFYEIDNNFIDGQPRLFKHALLRKIWKSRRIPEQILKSGEYTPYKYIKPTLDKLIQFSLNNQIDCLIVSGPDITANIPYLRKKLLPSTKIIAWQHNNANTYINVYAKKFKTAFINGLSMADRVVCLTDSDYDKYKNYNPSITRIYNPLTIDNEGKITNLNSKIISFVGRLSIEHKGIDYLIEVASKLPLGWTIKIAGTGDDNSMKQINSLIKKYKVEDKIIFCGALKNEDMIDHYFNSSLYIMTSRWEGLPLVLAEAMSFGLPIIAFENTGANEVLNYGEFGRLVENGNVEEMSKELKLFTNNIQVRTEYQKKSLDRVKDFYLEHIISEWENMLFEVVYE